MVRFLAVLVFGGCLFVLGLIVGLSRTQVSDEELSVAYSRGCGDCRCKVVR